jgi:hypothetical protein
MPNYATVTWTGGDTITEAKLDNMVANDRAEDAHESGVYFLNSTGKVKFRNASSVLDAEIYEDSNNILQFVRGAGGYAGLDINLATQLRGSIASGANKAQFPPATRAFTINEVLVQVAADGTQAAGDMTFDINKGGTSIWAATQANRLKLLAASARGTQTSFDTTAVAKYDNFSLDVDTTDTTALNLLFVIIGR